MSAAKAYCSGTGKRISRIRSVARTVSSRRRMSGRAMEVSKGHESFLMLSNRGALSILQRASGRILCDSSLRWLDVSMCTDASANGFAFAVREGFRELASDFGRVSQLTRFQEKLQVHPCQVACASLHRGGSRFEVFKFGRG